MELERDSTVRTTSVYDALHRTVSIKQPDNGVVTTTYDAAGNVRTQIDPLNHTTSYGYDAANRQITVTDPLGFTTTTAYDAASHRLSLTDADHNTTTWAYDAAGRMTSETDPLNHAATYAYDADNRLASTTDRLGRRHDFAFDDAGRNATEKWYDAGGSLTQTQTFTYDAADRRLTAQDPDGTYTYTYDDASRVSVVKEPFGLTLTFGYDASSNRTSVQDSLGGRTTVTFDARNLQTAEELGGSGITAIKETRNYTNAGQLDTVTRQKLSGGVWTDVAKTTYAYDAVGRMSRINLSNATPTTLATYAYSYDVAGRMTAKVENGATTSYAYDVTDQLTQDGTTTFGYDATGDRTNTGYATGSGNRTTNDGVWTYTYDAMGDVTKKSKGASSDTWNYTYDNRNQMLTAAFSATDGGTVTQRVTYTYDALGNRIQRQGWNGTTATTERYGLDGWDTAKPMPIGNENFDEWAILDGSNALVTRWVSGTEFDEHVASETSGGTVSWYGTDQLGSVRKVIDNSGSITSSIDYDAFGNATSGTVAMYGYAGVRYDGTTTYYSNGDKRELNPKDGRFMQTDDMGLTAGVGLYNYVKNQATRATDPSGYTLYMTRRMADRWVEESDGSLEYRMTSNNYARMIVNDAARTGSVHDKLKQLVPAGLNVDEIMIALYDGELTHPMKGFNHKLFDKVLLPNLNILKWLYRHGDTREFYEYPRTLDKDKPQILPVDATTSYEVTSYTPWDERWDDSPPRSKGVPWSLKPNWSNATGKLTFTGQRVTINLNCSSKEDVQKIESNIWDGMKVFKDFNANNIAKTRMIPGGTGSQFVGFTTNHPFMAWLQSQTSGDAPDGEVYVRIFPDETTKTITAVTLGNHMIVGVRRWSIRTKTAEATSVGVSAGDLVMQIETSAWEQRNNQATDLGFRLAGREDMLKVWIVYLTNMAKDAQSQSKGVVDIQYSQMPIIERDSSEANPYSDYLPPGYREFDGR